jgi:hypothetical protein
MVSPVFFRTRQQRERYFQHFTRDFGLTLPVASFLWLCLSRARGERSAKTERVSYGWGMAICMDSVLCQNRASSLPCSCAIRPRTVARCWSQNVCNSSLGLQGRLRILKGDERAVAAAVDGCIDRSAVCEQPVLKCERYLLGARPQEASWKEHPCRSPSSPGGAITPGGYRPEPNARYEDFHAERVMRGSRTRRRSRPRKFAWQTFVLIR